MKLDLRFSENMRSSLPKLFCKKALLKKFAKLIGKRLHWNLFFNKLQTLDLFWVNVLEQLLNRTPVKSMAPF